MPLRKLLRRKANYLPGITLSPSCWYMSDRQLQVVPHIGEVPLDRALIPLETHGQLRQGDKAPRWIGIVLLIHEDLMHRYAVIQERLGAVVTRVFLLCHHGWVRG